VDADKKAGGKGFQVKFPLNKNIIFLLNSPR
jgi:hypothetical protein